MSLSGRYREWGYEPVDLDQGLFSIALEILHGVKKPRQGFSNPSTFLISTGNISRLSN